MVIDLKPLGKFRAPDTADSLVGRWRVEDEAEFGARVVGFVGIEDRT